MWKFFVERWKRWQQARRDSVMFERAWVVSFDDSTVRLTCPNGDTQSIQWDEVIRVAIETNDSGPWGADVWWCLEGANASVKYPQGATGDPEMLTQYPIRFQGFSDQAVIEAMGCTSNARVVCWERANVA